MSNYDLDYNKIRKYEIGDNKTWEESKPAKTVKDLMEILKDVPEDTKIYFCDDPRGTVFDLEVGIGSQISCEHNGTQPEYNGVIFYVDG